MLTGKRAQAGNAVVGSALTDVGFLASSRSAACETRLLGSADRVQNDFWCKSFA